MIVLNSDTTHPSTARSDGLDIEMHTLDRSEPTSAISTAQNSTTELRNISQLPPVDRGKAAWGFVLGGLLIEGLAWGYVFSFGVFQKYLSSQGPFEANKAVSSVGTVASGVGYLGAPLIQRLIIQPFPAYRRTIMLGALGLCITGCLAASFANQIWQLILTQGILFGMGIGILSVTFASLLNEWFIARRGLACGIVFGGGGAFGIALPPFFDFLFTSVGYANTLRIWSAMLLVILAPSIIFLIKPRLPVTQATTSTKLDYSVVRKPLFLFMAFANLFQALGYFIPGIYLPTYASDLNIPPIQSTLVLSLLNLANIFGQIGLGGLSDIIGPVAPLILSAGIGGLAVSVLWGLSKNFAVLSAFSLIYGASAGGYSVLWTKIAMEISNDPSTQLAVWGFYTFERGIGNIIAGPVSASLLGSSYHKDSYAGSKYESMVIFTGVVMAISALGMSLNTFKWQKSSSLRTS